MGSMHAANSLVTSWRSWFVEESRTTPAPEIEKEAPGWERRSRGRDRWKERGVEREVKRERERAREVERGRERSREREREREREQLVHSIGCIALNFVVCICFLCRCE